MIRRILAEKVIQLASKFPVISITGPRQSGKTTLAQQCFPGYSYVNLELLDNRIFAQTDTRGFINNYNNGVIIDEAQYVPDLFSYIQGFVDQSKKNGEFILTGSQNFLLAHNISQSLAGRVAVLHLLPFSINELSSNKLLPDDYLPFLYNGTYPRVYDQKINPIDFYPSYLQTYLERDLRNILNVKDLSAFRVFLEITAGRTGQMVNYASISNTVGIDQKTVKNWFSVLEASFIIFFLRPHHKNFNKRLVKTPKLYFYDTGLICSLLGIKNKDEIHSHYHKGAIFENMVISELWKNQLNIGNRPDMYFWRNNTGNEIDCIIQNREQVKIVEIKSAKTINNNFFKELKYYQNLSGISNKNSFLIYGGDEKQKRRDATILSWKNLDELF